MNSFSRRIAELLFLKIGLSVIVRITGHIITEFLKLCVSQRELVLLGNSSSCVYTVTLAGLYTCLQIRKRLELYPCSFGYPISKTLLRFFYI